MIIKFHRSSSIPKDLHLMFRWCQFMQLHIVCDIVLTSHLFMPTESYLASHYNWFNRTSTVRRYLHKLPYTRLLEVSSVLASGKIYMVFTSTVCCLLTIFDAKWWLFDFMGWSRTGLFETFCSRNSTSSDDTVNTIALFQYKDRLSQVWEFPC